MNFHKNYYKLCLPSLMACLGIIILGIAIALILGYNTQVATPYGLGGIIFYLGVYLLAVSVFDLVYLRIRFNWSTGFVVVLKNFVDILLLISIIAIIRVPVTLSTVASCVLTTLFGNVISLILIKNANEQVKTQTDYKKLSNDLIEKNILLILIVSLALMVVLSMLLGTGLQSMLSFVLAGIVGIIVSAFTSLFILVPVWLGFVKRELKIKEKNRKTDERKVVENNNQEIKQETIQEETKTESATQIN